MPTVERDVEIDADPEQVWSDVVDSNWIGTGVLEPEVGGAVDLADADTGERRVGIVHEVDPGRRLRYAWWPTSAPTEVSEVEIVLVPTIVGTRVTVIETAGESLRWSMRLFALATVRVTAGR